MKALLPMLALATGCAELGMSPHAKSCSMGTVSRGYLNNGVRLPDAGEGYTTQEVWRTRGNRFGTDEMIDLLVGTGRRLAQSPGARLVVADLSATKGGKVRQWHKAHQNGRDVDLVYFMRDATGAVMEADSMRAFDPDGLARDGSGVTVDFPRTWELVRSLLTADEAVVQWVFMYQPFADKLIAHATAIGESPELVARAALVMKQPGDSAKHDDHIHVRIYCADRDLVAGCRDVGPMEPMLEYIAARARGETFANWIAQMLNAPADTVAASFSTPMTAAPSLSTSMSTSVMGAPMIAPASTSTGATFFLRWP